MNIKLDGKTVDFQGKTVLDLSKSFLSLAPKGFVVAINKKLITKSKWSSFELKENDEILILHPAEGG